MYEWCFMIPLIIWSSDWLNFTLKTQYAFTLYEYTGCLAFISWLHCCFVLLQIPRYILTLHELLAHTPHEHIERNSLDYAKSKLEELSRYLLKNSRFSIKSSHLLKFKSWFHVLYSRIMHDEVSETENIRKNLAIERMIIEGCEVLLDTSQTFVRQGIIHLLHNIMEIIVLPNYLTSLISQGAKGIAWCS